MSRDMLMHIAARFVAVPADDEVFATQVEEIALEIGDGAPSAFVVQGLADRLRQRYPRVRVRRRSSLASFNAEPVWYVYRDGGALSR